MLGYIVGTILIIILLFVLLLIYCCIEINKR